MSVWKANKVKAEANGAGKNKQPQPAAPKTNTGADAGRNRTRQQLAACRTQVSGAAANAGKSIKRTQQPAVAKEQVNVAASAAVTKPFQF
mgnify:CR=1 FL=1